MDGKPFGCRRPLSAVSLSVQEIATDECSNLSVQNKVGQNRQKPTGRNREKKHDETNSIFRKGCHTRRDVQHDIAQNPGKMK